MKCIWISWGKNHSCLFINHGNNLWPNSIHYKVKPTAGGWSSMFLARPQQQGAVFRDKLQHLSVHPCQTLRMEQHCLCGNDLGREPRLLVSSPIPLYRSYCYRGFVHVHYIYKISSHKHKIDCYFYAPMIQVVCK